MRTYRWRGCKGTLARWGPAWFWRRLRCRQLRLLTRLPWMPLHHDPIVHVSERTENKPLAASLRKTRSRFLSPRLVIRRRGFTSGWMWRTGSVRPAGIQRLRVSRLRARNVFGWLQLRSGLQSSLRLSSRPWIPGQRKGTLPRPLSVPGRAHSVLARPPGSSLASSRRAAGNGRGRSARYVFLILELTLLQLT